MKTSLCAYLRKKRVEASMSQADLAKLLGCQGQFVSNWERGVCKPPRDAILKMIPILKIPPAEILRILMAENNAHWKKLLGL